MTNCDFFRRVVAVSILAIGAPAFGQADLAVTKTVSNAVPVEGEEIVYTVTVTNDGPSDASGVTVADQLPAGVTFVGVDSIDQGSYDEIAGAWDVGDLGESASVQLAVRASVDAGTAETTGTGDFIDVFTSGDVNTIARGVTFGPDGDLYVTNGNVRRFDGTTGAFIGVFADDPMLGFSVGLTFGPDGNLYVADITNDHIVRFDGATGAFIDVFASGGLDDPDGIVFGPDGHLYVSSFFNDRVIRYDGATGALIDVFATGGGLDGPQGLTFGADGNLYVSSLLNGQVIRYDGSTGAPIDVFVTGGSSPHGLRFGPDGHLYVSSFINDVVRYDGTTGAFIDTFASDAALTMVQGLTFGPDGNLYVVSDGTDEVVRFQGFITNIADVAATSADPDLLDNSDFAGITVLAPTPFEPPVEEPAEGAPLIHAVGDLDTSLTSMGTVDVAVVIPDADPGVNGEVQIFLNLGNGMGGLWLGLDPQLPTIPVGPDPTGIALGDLTGDDYLDFAVTNAGNDTVSFFVNNADDTGTFTAGPVVGGTFDMPSAIVTGEFGAGAGLDFAVANEGSSEVDIIGNPLTPIATVTVGLNPVALDVRDLDDDRDLDLVSANLGGDSVTAIINEGAGVFSVQTDVPVGLDPVDLAIGDLNLDGRPDVITANSADGTITILLNQGPPNGSGVVFNALPPIAAGIQPISVDAVDLDGDLDLDLVVAGEDPIAGPALLLIENQLIPSGFFTFADPVPVVIGADPQYVLNGDFNDDGPPDLVTVNIDADQPTGGSVTVLINTVFPCPGDFNEDGAVGFGDILALIGLWGPCGIGITCPGDLNFDGSVGFGDILFVISNWGPCVER